MKSERQKNNIIVLDNVKPLFRYIGGKTFLKNTLNKNLEIILNNKKITKYEEWFAGGLGSFLAVADTLLKYEIKEVFLNDINSNLISLYKNINKGYAKHIINLYIEIEQLFQKTIPLTAYNRHKLNEKDILKIELKNAQAFYKHYCKAFNAETGEIEKSAYLIFLQNHCFNGIYRENQKGEYNTPFNWSPRIITKEYITKKIEDIYNLLKNFNTTFSNVSFEQLSLPNSETLIYLDPPYLNNISSSNKYNKNSFDLNKQFLLIDKIIDQNFIYSNHLDDRIINYFKDKLKSDNLDYEIISRKNTISASVESRKTDKFEILIKHY